MPRRSMLRNPHRSLLPRPHAARPARIVNLDANGLALRELAMGLARRPREIASKYFYDDAGSALFEQITALPEYYPTRTEASIFARHGAEMAQAIGTGTALIDLGAGNCAKAASLLSLIHI